MATVADNNRLLWRLDLDTLEWRDPRAKTQVLTGDPITCATGRRTSIAPERRAANDPAQLAIYDWE